MSFTHWLRFSLEPKLSQKGLDMTMTWDGSDSSTAKKDDLRARGYLVPLLARSQSVHIKEESWSAKNSVKCILDDLRYHHVSHSETGEAKLSIAYGKLRWNEKKETLNKFIARCNDIILKMKSMQLMESFTLQTSRFMDMMPLPFESAVTKVEIKIDPMASTSHPMKMFEIQEYLLMEYEKFCERKPDVFRTRDGDQEHALNAMDT